MKKKKKPKPQPKISKTKLAENTKIAEKLQHIADKNGMSCAFVATRVDMLKKAKLPKKSITPAIITEAERLDRQETHTLRKRVWNLGGKVNNTFSPEKEAALKAERKKQEKPKPQPTTTNKSNHAAIPRTPQPRGDRDVWGTGINTSGGQINAVLLNADGPITAEDIEKIVECNKSRVGTHLCYLRKRELITVEGKGNTKTYSVVLTHTKPEPKKKRKKK